MKLVLILMFSFFSIKGFSIYQVEDYLIFNNDTLYFSNSPKYTSKDKIYVYADVEIPPQFNNKSAEAGFREYVEKNLKDFDGVQARIFVEFIIEEDGSISNVKLLRGADQLLDEEALRVVNSSPKWTPGKVRGETVRVKYIYPVVFNHYRTNW